MRSARRWAFTLSNAGAYYFEDRSDLGQLDEIDWNAGRAPRTGGQCKDGKQAEFLLEQSFPWHLVERIGVQSRAIYTAGGQRAARRADTGHRSRSGLTGITDDKRGARHDRIHAAATS